MLEPNRKQERMERAEPNEVASKMDIVEPNTALLKALNPDPIRA